jgi:hypothetical protein
VETKSGLIAPVSIPHLTPFVSHSSLTTLRLRQCCPFEQPNRLLLRCRSLRISPCKSFTNVTSIDADEPSLAWRKSILRNVVKNYEDKSGVQRKKWKDNVIEAMWQGK